MEEKILKYKNKHKRCKYCKHLKFDMGRDTVPPFFMCLAKDKVIRDFLPDMTEVPRLFCQCYEVKEEN